ncbi:MAG TPA: hypothetical protein VGF52_04540, partial [Tepidisphaeraceae bacterium]
MSLTVRSKLKWLYLLELTPGFTIGPERMVAMRLLSLPSSSSHVTTSKLLCAFAHVSYVPRFFDSHPSPVATDPSCMS